MPYPARTTVLRNGFQASPGGSEIIAVRTDQRDGKLAIVRPGSPTCTGTGGEVKPAGKSRFTMRSFSSEKGEMYS